MQIDEHSLVCLYSTAEYLYKCNGRKVVTSSLTHQVIISYSLHVPTYIYLQTLMRSYLLKIDGKVAERPQHMLMRVAIGIHQNDIKAACETYRLMSEKWFTHASPTLFNAGTCKPQMSSCFLLTMSDDSIDGIYETLSTCAKISKAAGGIGLNVHNIRASGSYIAGVRCYSNIIIL